jgi:hypothetical protein
MSDPKPQFPNNPIIPKNEDIYMGLRSKYFIDAMRQKVPGLYEKLSSIKQGEVLNLSKPEKEFFIDLVMGSTEGASSLIIDIANKIWGTHGIEWMENGRRRMENIAAALWWHFCSSNLSQDRVEKLVDFYLGTTKEQAEIEVSKWKDWEGRTNIKLVK